MSDVQSLFKQAEQLKDEGKREEAAAMLLDLLQIDPSHILSHLTLGRIFTQLGRHAEAIQHSLKACELEPTDSFNFTALSVTYQRAFAGTGDRQFIYLAEEAMARARSME